MHGDLAATIKYVCNTQTTFIRICIYHCVCIPRLPLFLHSSNGTHRVCMCTRTLRIVRTPNLKTAIRTMFSANPFYACFQIKSGTNKCNWCLENNIPASDDSLSIRYKTDADVHLQYIVADVVEAQRVTNFECKKSADSTQTDAAHAVEWTLPITTDLAPFTVLKKRIIHKQAHICNRLYPPPPTHTHTPITLHYIN